MSHYFKLNEDFVAPARAKSEWWRILAVLVIFVVIYAGISLAIMTGGMLFASDEELMVVTTSGHFSTPYLMVLVMLTFAGMTLGLVCNNNWPRSALIRWDG